MHVVSCPHSQLVRSQVFSTSQRFPHGPSSTALFHTATVPELPPFRVFPSRRSCTPLGATGSLAVVHRAAETYRPRPYRSRFHRRPRFWRSCLDSPRTMGPLFTSPKTRFPVALGRKRLDRSYRQLHLLRSFFPSASPFALPRVTPSLVADPLLVFRPSWDSLPPRPRIL